MRSTRCTTPIDVFSRFFSRAEASPARTALVFGERSVSYAELERRTAEIADVLASLGLKEGDRVGVLFDRSIEQIACILAAVKIGVAFVPLDPRYPVDRLEQMLDLAEVNLVVGTDRHVARLQERPSRALLPWSRVITERGSEQAHANPVLVPSPDGILYVVFTSGSTGEPKGVAMSRGCINHLIGWQCARSPKPDATTLQFSPASFDVSIQEIFGTLGAGGTLVLPREEIRSDPEALIDLISKHQIERLFMPFVALQALARAAVGQMGRISYLCEIATAGEQLRIDSALDNFFRELPGCILDNHYGPTETHAVLAYRLPGDRSRWETLPPVGDRICDHVFAYLLDDDLNPVADGEIGEIYAGGQALALGYVSRPGATAERFVPDPFSTSAGARMYRTGDLGRRRTDGQIEFLGRADDQVKVRGFRVDLGEVDGHLENAPGVAHAAAAVRDVGGISQLQGFVVPSSPETTADAVRSWLLNHVPEHLIPSRIELVPEIPLTSSGKVSRRGLLALEPRDAAASRAQTADLDKPTSELELQLAEIWTSVLSVESIRLSDAFVALGGHSLLASVMLAKVKKQLGVAMSARDLLQFPTLGDFVDRVEERMQEDRSAEAAPDAGTKEERDIVRGSLSPYQDAILWADLQDNTEGFSPYQELEYYWLQKPLDPRSVKGALTSLFVTEQTLRSRIELVRGTPYARVLKFNPDQIHVFDHRDSPRMLFDGLLRASFEALYDAEQIYDPEIRTGPAKAAAFLFRDDTVIVLLRHHIWTDGHTQALTADRLADALAGVDLEPSDSARKHEEFLAWLDKHAAVQGKEDLEYWRNKLREEVPGLTFIDTSKEPGKPLWQTVDFEPELLARLDDFAAQRRCTRFALLKSLWAAVLCRFSGHHQVRMGVPMSTRPEAWKNEFGCYVNPVVIHTEVDNDASLDSLVEQVSLSLAEADTHKYAPLAEVAQTVTKVEQRQRLTDVVFAMLPILDSTALGARAEIGVLPPMKTTFPLNVLVFSGSDTLTLALEFSPAQVDPGIIESMGNALVTLANAALAAPNAPLASHALQSEEAGIAQLRRFNDSQRRYPVPDVLAMIEAQAVERPTATALRLGDEVVTYSEFVGRSNQMARYLQRAGVQRGDFVATCLERSAEAVIALTAILKSGAAYFPLDLDSPIDRIKALLQEVAPRVLLASKEQRKTVLAGLDQKILETDTKAAEIESESSDPLNTRLEPDDLAHLFYTSGSTGRPKGVMVRYEAMCNRMMALQHLLPLSPSDRMMHRTPHTFDVSTWEMFWTLSQGAELTIAEAGRHTDPNYVSELARDGRITTLNFVPSMLQLWLDDPGAADLPLLRHVLSTGEDLPPTVVKTFFERFPDATLSNLCGATEADFSYFLCQRDVNYRNVPVGKPGRNMSMYILDDELRPVPCGVVGEIYIGGLDVARGYLQQASLTAEKFIPDPFAPQPGARMYASGDFARWLPTGDLEFVGRIDAQIQLHGLRIELGEIETALAEHPTVRDAAVVVREDRNGNKQIVGYYRLVPGKSETVDQLLDFLGRKLPRYAVPAALVPIESYPMTEHGKLDQRALPEPGEEDFGAEARDSVADEVFATAMQQQIADLWADILKVEVPNSQVNFYALGGTSLSAVRMISRVNAKFQVKIIMREIFRQPNVAGIEELIKSKLSAVPKGDSAESAESAQSADATASPLSLMANALITGRWSDGHTNPMYNMIEKFEVSGAFDEDLFRKAVRALIDRHEALRTRLFKDGDEVRMAIEENTVDVVDVVDISHLSEDDQEQAIAECLLTAEKTPFPWDLTQRCRFFLHRRSRERATVVASIDHSLSDGWSHEVLQRDLWNLYHELSAGKDSSQQRPTQYREFVTWQRREAARTRQRDEAHLSHILDTAAGTQLVTPSKSIVSAQPIHDSIPPDLVRQIRAFAKSQGVSVATVLTAGAALLRWTMDGENCTCVATTFDGRDDPRFADTIGNLLSIQTAFVDKIDSGQSVAEFFEACERAVTACWRHQNADSVARFLAANAMELLNGFKMTYTNRDTSWQGYSSPDLKVSRCEMTWPMTTEYKWCMYASDEGDDSISFVLVARAENFTDDQLANSLRLFYDGLRAMTDSQPLSLAQLRQRATKH